MFDQKATSTQRDGQGKETSTLARGGRRPTPWRHGRPLADAVGPARSQPVLKTTLVLLFFLVTLGHVCADTVTPLLTLRKRERERE